jgi:peptide/nickel transport system permease protein
MVKAVNQGYWRIVGRQFRRSVMSVVALIVLIGIGFIALAAPFLAGTKPIYMNMEGQRYWLPNIIDYSDLVSFDFDAWTPSENDSALLPLIPHSPDKSDLYNTLKPPSKDHLLGTDNRGRDILCRIIWGTRISMTIGFIAVGISLSIGVFLGAVGGYYGGKIDAVVMRMIEVMLCFPTLILILALVAMLPPSIYNIMIALGFTQWTSSARLVRGEFLTLRESDFATAARATGLGDGRIIFRHLLPNALGPVLVSATFGVAGAILIESSLSFLGFGVPPPTSSWGEILSQSKRYISFAWWLVLFPGAAIFFTVTAFNLVGEGLRDAMDPRLRQ